jgi:hypothetical protein
LPAFASFCQLLPAFAVLLFLTSNLFGQTNPDLELHPIEIPAKFHPEEDCFIPQYSVKSVLLYQNSATCYIEVPDAEGEGQLFLSEKGSSAIPKQFTIRDGKLLIENLPLNTEFGLLVYNSCEKMALFAKIDTKIGFRDVFEASPAFYSSIIAFQKTNDQSLVDFLQKEILDVSYYEKLDFFQQHLMRGQSLPENLNFGQFPENIFTERGGAICNCTFLQSTYCYANPGIMNADQSITAEYRWSVNGAGSAGSATGPLEKIEYSNNSRFWWGRGAKGAAKWDQLWSEGKLAGGSTRTTTIGEIDPAAQGFSGRKGQLGFNLHCTNYTNVPEACACAKPITYYWEYGSSVTTFADVGSNPLATFAAAAAQDIVSVLYQEDGQDPQILAVNTIKVVSECDREINDAFWSNGFTFASNLAIIVAGTVPAGNNNQPLLTLTAQQITNLGNSAATVLNTPVFLPKGGCNSSSIIEFPGIMGNTGVGFGAQKFTLKPNKPVIVTLSSLTNMKVEGKRDWSSWARIHSRYHLTGRIKGGRDNDGSDLCCTPEYARYVLGSMDNPDQTKKMQDAVGNCLKLWFHYYPQIPGGGLLVNHEFGTFKENLTDCERIIIIDPATNNGGFAPNGITDRFNPNSTYKVTVADVSGKILFQNNQYVPDYEMFYPDFLRSLGVQQTGLYFIKIGEKKSARVEKVFLR